MIEHVKGCILDSNLLFIYNIRRIARLFPTVHYALNLRDTARNELDRNMERRYDFRCRRKPKCSEKTCAGKYGSRTKFTYDSAPTGNRTRAALVKGTGTTAAPTHPLGTGSNLVVIQNLCKTPIIVVSHFFFLWKAKTCWVYL